MFHQTFTVPVSRLTFVGPIIRPRTVSLFPCPSLKPLTLPHGCRPLNKPLAVTHSLPSPPSNPFANPPPSPPPPVPPQTHPNATPSPPPTEWTPKLTTLFAIALLHFNLLSFSAEGCPRSTTVTPPKPPLPLNGLTRTLTTLFAIALPLFNLVSYQISLLSLELGPILPNPNTLGPLFFAAISNGSAPRSTGTPIAVIATGLAKWLDIYSCVLLIRVLLSWFPNIPWDKQPTSAIRDLCDPYLSLFRGVIPPLFNSLDVSPILAFLLLGMIGQLARPPRPY